MVKKSSDRSTSRFLGKTNGEQKPTEQIDLFKWEDKDFDADKDLKERTQKRLEEKQTKEEERALNEIDWKEVNEFTKSTEYQGHLCIKVSGNGYLDESTSMKYQYEGMDGAMQDGAMSGGGGYNCLRTLDRGIQGFLRTCEHYKIPGRIFFSKAAEDLTNKWIEESNNYKIQTSGEKTFEEVKARIHDDSNPSDDLWDDFEYLAIKEWGYEIGVKLLKKEYIDWRRQALAYQLKDIEKWQEMWIAHGPMDFYIERVEHPHQTYNFHGSRLNLKTLDEPPFLRDWKKELEELEIKRRNAREKQEFEQLKKKKEDRKVKLETRKKGKQEKESSEKETRSIIYGTPFTEKMKAAKDANEGRDIITEYTKAFHDLEIEAGLTPTVGDGGSGFAYRGFSTLSKTDVKKAIKRLSEKNAELGEKLKAMIDDIRAAEVVWGGLYKIEIGALMEEVHCRGAKTKEVA